MFELTHFYVEFMGHFQGVGMSVLPSHEFSVNTGASELELSGHLIEESNTKDAAKYGHRV